MSNKKKGFLRQAIVIGSTSFVIAILLSIGTGVVVNKFRSLILALVFLFAIMIVGIIFDIIGVATTAAEASPFHAKASKKVKGSKQANLMLSNADKVAAFCNDVVGDICGTVSGSLGAAIVFLIVAHSPGLNNTVVATLMTGIIAGLTVGGKAAGKMAALKHPEKIVFRVGRVLAWIEELTGFRVFSGKKPRKAREKVAK